VTTFTVWKFESPEGAAAAEKTVLAAEAEGLVHIDDHLVISWPADAEQPEVRHKHSNSKRGAGWGALWGVAGGALFAIPVAGAVVGAGIGALARAKSDSGINKEDLERIRDEVTPGTSALFLVTDSADFDRLGERFHGHDSTLVSTNLTDAEREILLETFGSG
jgi:uncharacterized membrane protein